MVSVTKRHRVPMSTFVDVVQQGRKMAKIHPLTQLENGLVKIRTVFELIHG